MQADIIANLQKLRKNHQDSITEIDAIIKAIESQNTSTTPKVIVNDPVIPSNDLPTLAKPENPLHLIVAAGHGGMHEGKYMTNPLHGKFYTFLETNETAYEGVNNRQIADKFCELAIKAGFVVHKVYHEYLDWDLNTISNKEKAIKASLPKGAKSIYLSFHANANGMANRGYSLPTKGWCCFIYKNPKTGVISPRGYQVATAIEKAHREMVKDKGFDMTFRDAGTFFKEKQAIWANNLHETRETGSPACLVEGGYFTNLEEWKLISSPQWQTATAEAKVKACLELAKTASFAKL